MLGEPPSKGVATDGSQISFVLHFKTWRNGKYPVHLLLHSHPSSLLEATPHHVPAKEGSPHQAGLPEHGLSPKQTQTPQPLHS